MNTLKQLDKKYTKRYGLRECDFPKTLGVGKVSYMPKPNLKRRGYFHTLFMSTDQTVL